MAYDSHIDEVLSKTVALIRGSTGLKEFVEKQRARARARMNKALYGPGQQRYYSQGIHIRPAGKYSHTHREGAGK